MPAAIPKDKEILYAHVPKGVKNFLKKEAIDCDLSLSELLMQILADRYDSFKKQFCGNNSKVK